MRFAHSFSVAAVASIAFAWSSSAHAVQPLDTFLSRAMTHAYDAREAAATRVQRDAEADAALGRLLPSLTARGVYTYNQYEIAATIPGAGSIVIQPQNQLDAFFQVDVPIVDVSGYYRYRSASAASRATDEIAAATTLDVGRAVTRAYYQYIGANALARSAVQSVALAEANERHVADRKGAGLSTELDRERARASTERARQDIADANLLVALASRSLETLTGIVPEASQDLAVDDLHEEAPLAQWLSRTGDTPSERAAHESAVAADDARKSARAALLPTLSATGQQRFTNATGFANRSSLFFIQLSLTWRLDYTTYATSRAQAAASEVAQVRDQRQRRGVSDSVFEAYQRVTANIAKSRSSRAQAVAAKRAAELAGDRYDAGASTQLEVTQAQRDSFLAEASRISADADLAFSRAALRLAIGRSPSDPRSP